MKIKKPKVGSKIYVNSSFYISHGSDDFVGGIATISKVYQDISGGKKTWFIEIEERPDTAYNYEILAEEQKKLKKEFGKQKAHPDPDIDTPWIEDGDWVDGKVYHGKDIW